MTNKIRSLYLRQNKLIQEHDEIVDKFNQDDGRQYLEDLITSTGNLIKTSKTIMDILLDKLEDEDELSRDDVVLFKTGVLVENASIHELKDDLVMLWTEKLLPGTDFSFIYDSDK